MALTRRKEVVTKQIDEIDYNELSDAVDALLSQREGRKVDNRDYAGREDAIRRAFEEAGKLGDRSWYSTPYTEFTDIQKKQHEIYKAMVDHLPYMDFWHWWLENVDLNVESNSTSDITWADSFEYLVEELEESINEQIAENIDPAMDKFHLTVLRAFNEVLLTIYTQEELDGTIQIYYSH